MHQVIIELLLKLSFLLVCCAILSLIVDHVFELIGLLAELVADFTDVAPRVRHLFELLEVLRADVRKLSSIHPVRMIRRLYHLFILTAGSGLCLICGLVGRARQWSGHLVSI